MAKIYKKHSSKFEAKVALGYTDAVFIKLSHFEKQQ